MSVQLTPVERDCPPGWTARKVIKIEETDHGVIATGWEIRRHGCDCQMFIGMRIESSERTFGIDPCDAHGAIAEATLMKLRMITGQERQIHALAGEIFEAKLAKAGA